MSRGRKIALFAALAAPLATIAVLLALAGEGAPPGPGPTSAPSALEAGEDDSAVAEEAARVEAEERAERAQERLHRHADEEGVVGEEVLAREERAQAEAEPVARRFFAAFARYELGDASAAVEAELAASATPGLAAELGRPPRIPPGVAAPKPVRLAGPLQLVAIDGNDAALSEIELVGESERGGERSPVALRIELRGGRWRVAALGR